MAETKHLKGQLRSPSVDVFLQEQQTLTAVEKFSKEHDHGLIPHQEKYYKALMPGKPPGPGQQYAFEVNLDRCSGCKACITGCHNLNGLDAGETWRAVGLVHGGNPSWSLAQPVNLKKSVIPESPVYFQQNVTTACHHCADPACLTGCPVKAYEKDSATGIVKHLDDQCIGCKYCIYRCPYEVPQYNQKLGIVRKCDMCMDRLQSGEAPACVQSCPNEAIRITTVNIKEVWNEPAKGFQIPSAPDPEYTKPTTIYKSSRPFPENAVSADHSVLQSQPPEFPLVFMLVFTQLSVGAFCVLSLFQNTFSTGSEIFFKIQSFIALGFCMLGLLLSTLHLGRPMYAFRAFLGLRTSWLSREICVFGLFLTAAVIHTAFFWSADLQHWVHAVLGLAAAGSGLLGVFCSAKIYMETPRFWWNSRQTLFKFFLTGGILGLGLTLVTAGFLSAQNMKAFDHTQLLAGILLALLGIKLGIEIQIFSIAHHSGNDALKKTALLIQGPLKNLAEWRVLSAIAGGLILFFSGIVPAGAATRAASALIGFLFLIAGECLERHLFFIAVVPPKMPGQILKAV